MEKINQTWTVFGKTFESKELAEAYLVKKEKIKKASEDLNLNNLINFQMKKKHKFSLNQITFSNKKEFAKFLLENSLELQEVMEEYKL